MSRLLILAQTITQDQVRSIPQGDLSGGPDGTLVTVLQLVIGFIGAISFLIIVIAGLKYVMSRGNPDEISKSKDTILYALVGLLVSMSALAIVTFVIGRA